MNTSDTDHDSERLREEALQEMRKAALLMRQLGKTAAHQTEVSIEAHKLRKEKEAITAQELHEKREQERQGVLDALQKFSGALPLAKRLGWEHIEDSSYVTGLHKPVELKSPNLEKVRLFEASVWWHKTTSSKNEFTIYGHRKTVYNEEPTPYYQIGERFIGERKRGKDAEIEMLLMPAIETSTPALLVVRTSLRKKDFVEELTLAELGKPLLYENAYKTSSSDQYSLRTTGKEFSNGNNLVAYNRTFSRDSRLNHKPGYYTGLPTITMNALPEADLTRKLLTDFHVEFYATRLATLFGVEEEYQRSLGAIDDPQVDTL